MSGQMRASVRVVAIGVLAAALLVAGAPAGSAAPILECRPAYGAPSWARGYADSNATLDGRAYYYHLCNVDPRDAGVTSMYMEVRLLEERRDGVVRLAPVGTGSGVRQQAALNTTIYSINLNYRHAGQMYLKIQGGFTYGAVPGCGRADARTVTCTWTGGWSY